MAIIDKNNKNWDVDSSDENQFIGLSLPLILDNGEMASTRTTIEAVKQNVYSLCSTEAGERVMQPNLGVRLKKFLFEPYSEELGAEIQDVINEGLKYWLPFVKVNNIFVRMSDNDSGDSRNILEVSVNFSLKQNPSTHESVQVTITGGEA